MEVKKIRTILFAIIALVMISSSFADALTEKKQGILALEWDDIGQKTTETALSEKVQGQLALFWDEDANNPSTSVEELQEKIDAMYIELGLKSGASSNVISNLLFNKTTGWIVTICFLVWLFYYGFKKQKLPTVMKFLSIFNRRTFTDSVQKLQSLVAKYRKNYQDVLEIYTKTAANIRDAEDNLKIAEQLERALKEGRIAELKDTQAGTAQNYQKILQERLEKIKEWSKRCQFILGTTIQISNIGKVDLELVQRDIVNRGSIVSQYNKKYISEEAQNGTLSQEIEQFRKIALKEHQELDERKQELLAIMKISSDLNFGLGQYQHECVKEQLLWIAKEQDGINLVLDGIKKGGEKGNQRIETGIKHISQAANALYTNMQKGLPHYKLILDAEEKLLKNMDSVLLLDQDRVKIAEQVDEKRPKKIIEAVLKSKEQGNQEKFIENMRLLFRIKGNVERGVRIELRPSVGDKVAQEWVDEYKKSQDLRRYA